MTFEVIQGQGQGEEMTSVPYRDYFNRLGLTIYWAHKVMAAILQRTIIYSTSVTISTLPLMGGPLHLVQ